jgi:hypothetical protein
MCDRPQHEGVRDGNEDTRDNGETMEEKAANLNFKSKMKALIVERKV